jgi:hypothetical protein
VFEVGYRAQPATWLTFSAAAFYSKLDDLAGGRITSGGFAIISNEAEGESSGIEAWAILQPSPRWKVILGLLELRQELKPKAGSLDAGAPAALGNDPRHTFKARSYYRVSDTIDFDLSYRYVSALQYLATVPGYSELDARIAWRFSDKIEIALVGTSLLHKGHVEFDEHGFPAVIPRAGLRPAARFVLGGRRDQDARRLGDLVEVLRLVGRDDVRVRIQRRDHAGHAAGVANRSRLHGAIPGATREIGIERVFRILEDVLDHDARSEAQGPRAR